MDCSRCDNGRGGRSSKGSGSGSGGVMVVVILEANSDNSSIREIFSNTIIVECANGVKH